ncbi:MAG: cyclic nucleotide-binding domain-containing protein [Actinomycetota bacterium]
MARIPKQVIQHFRNVPLFAGVSERGLRALVAAADEITEPAGKELVRQGEHSRELFVITEGSVAVTREGRKLNTLGPGDFFGEIALLSGGPRSATVTAETDVAVMILRPAQFTVVLDSEPRIMQAVLRALGERLRPLDERALG